MTVDLNGVLLGFIEFSYPAVEFHLPLTLSGLSGLQLTIVGSRDGFYLLSMIISYYYKVYTYDIGILTRQRVG